jgi:two-component system cell cycle response regulator
VQPRKDRILLIDDEVKLLDKMKDLLTEAGYDLVATRRGDEGVRLLEQQPFDLVITDLVMPGVSGREIMAYVKNNCPETLVIVITAYASIDAVIQALRDGAYDFITKPFQLQIVKAAIDRAFERIKLQRQLVSATHKLQLLAITDELTSLYNVRYFNERLAVEFERASRYVQPLSCIMMDVDYFKRINDECGHLKGDEVLRSIAGIVSESIRTSDSAARYGGDEFVLLLPQTDEEKSYLLAKRIKQSVAKHDFSDITGGLNNITVSLGVCTFPNDEIKQERDLIKLADDALCNAKQEGRNRVEVIK